MIEPEKASDGIYWEIHFHSPWGPIETAPKDETWVLITGGNPSPSEWYGSKNIPSMVVAMFFDHAWVFDNWDGGFRSEYIGPTHWMPLPEPPK
jgi:hypothetical protein